MALSACIVDGHCGDLGLGAGVCHADGLTDKVVRALRVAGPEIGVTVVTDNELKIGWKALRAQ